MKIWQNDCDVFYVYSGELSRIVILLCFQGDNDPCNPNPCLNGGTCTANNGNGNGYHCTCPSGQSGTDCETVRESLLYFISVPHTSVQHTYLHFVAYLFRTL